MVLVAWPDIYQWHAERGTVGLESDHPARREWKRGRPGRLRPRDQQIQSVVGNRRLHW